MVQTLLERVKFRLATREIKDRRLAEISTVVTTWPWPLTPWPWIPNQFFPRTGAYLSMKFGDNCSWITVTCSAGNKSNKTEVRSILHEFGEIAHYNGYYAVQGHSRSLIFVVIESSYFTFYSRTIVTYLLSRTISKWSH